MYQQVIDSLLLASGLKPASLEMSLAHDIANLKALVKQEKNAAKSLQQHSLIEIMERLIKWQSSRTLDSGAQEDGKKTKERDQHPGVKYSETVSLNFQFHIAQQLMVLCFELQHANTEDPFIFPESVSKKRSAIDAAYQLYAGAGDRANSDSFEWILATLLQLEGKTATPIKTLIEQYPRIRLQDSSVNAVFNGLLNHFMTQENEQVTALDFHCALNYAALLGMEQESDFLAWKQSFLPQVKGLKDQLKPWNPTIAQNIEKIDFSTVVNMNKEGRLALQCRALVCICVTHPNFAPLAAKDPTLTTHFQEIQQRLMPSVGDTCSLIIPAATTSTNPTLIHMPLAKPLTTVHAGFANSK